MTTLKGWQNHSSSAMAMTTKWWEYFIQKMIIMFKYFLILSIVFVYFQEFKAHWYPKGLNCSFCCGYNSYTVDSPSTRTLTTTTTTIEPSQGCTADSQSGGGETRESPELIAYLEEVYSESSGSPQPPDNDSPRSPCPPAWENQVRPEA